MREGGRANALLVELLLVIFFFMICAAVLSQVYADGKLKSRTAEATNAVMLEAQNLSEEIYGSDDPEAVLSAYGFTENGDEYVLEHERYTLRVTKQTEQTEVGILRTYQISGLEGDKVLMTIPSTKYIPGEVSP